MEKKMLLQLICVLASGVLCSGLHALEKENDIKAFKNLTLSIPEKESDNKQTVAIAKTSDLLFPDKELKEFQSALTDCDKEIWGLKDYISYEIEWKSFISSYNPVSVVKNIDLETFITQYRTEKITVDESSSQETIVNVYRKALIAHNTLEGAEVRIDPFVALIVKILEENQSNRLQSWCCSLMAIPKSEALRKCREAEDTAEKSFERLKEKTKLFNELNSKTLFLETIKGKALGKEKSL